MTPKQVTTIDLNELKEIELKCECGASIRLPLPLPQGSLLAGQDCPACPRHFWDGTTHPTRLKVERLIKSVADWKDAANPTLSVRFVLTEESVSGS
jgi:hypothetical protein